MVDHVNHIILGDYSHPWQDVYEQSEEAKYPIGTGWHDGKYNRGFRYAKAGGNLAGIARAVINGNIIPGDTGGSTYGYEGSLYAEAAAGQNIVYIADATAAHVEDWYDGGMFTYFRTDAVANYSTIPIEKSWASNGSTYTKLRLAHNLPCLLKTSYGISAYPNQYRNVKAAMSVAQGKETFIGVALIPITNGNYFWLQTWGPFWFAGLTDHWPGDIDYGREAYFWIDGTLTHANNMDPSTYSPQRAGYVINSSATAYGDGLIFLQLDDAR